MSVTLYTVQIMDRVYGAVGDFSFALATEDDTTASNVVGYMQEYSCALLTNMRRWAQADPQPTGVPATGPVGVSDAARLNFSDNSGGLKNYLLLPQPPASIYLMDGRTVDPAAISDLVTYVTSNVVNAGGFALNGLRGGVATQIALPAWPVYR